MRLSIDKTINNILDKLDDSIFELAKGASESLEFQIESNGVKIFLLNQYDIRLQNLLKSQDIDIHHLESGIKNKIIQRKQKLFEEITTLSQN
ncbi:MAG: hypothetical protein HW410_1418 [Nitrosarchaeum sp.]|nr:hypothetical protein [Nitrosarchaeum sp.]